MLDSLGSTLSRATVKTFFERNGKDPEKQELTTDEVVQCLEKEVSRPREERKSINIEEPIVDSGSVTPMIQTFDGVGMPAPSPRFDKLDFSGPPLPSQPRLHSSYQGTNHYVNSTHSHRGQAQLRKPSLPPAYWTEPSQQPVLGNNPPASPNLSPSMRPHNLPYRENSGSSSEAEELSSGGSASQTTSEDVERVINVKTCPLCHRPRLNSKVEMDIVTHIAVCASQDWNRVDRIVVGNFVTPSQAQRKWLMKMISKVSSGAYQLGAVSVFLLGMNSVWVTQGRGRTLQILLCRIGLLGN
jgi:phosphatidylserine decarboxylase